MNCRLVNGEVNSSKLFTKAIQESLPVVVLKYTGYTADIATQAIENAKWYNKRRKINKDIAPVCPYPDIIDKKYRHPKWLKPFDVYHRNQCREANVFIENFPDNFNEASVYVMDMFEHSEDEIQDRLTQTMAVAFEGTKEAGAGSDFKRVAYAWRLRYKLLFNAKKFRFQSDFLTTLVTIFILLSTWTAVLYTYFDTQSQPLINQDTDEYIMYMLLQCNLLMPLVATIIKGIFSILNPLTKCNALKDAAASIESEIYMYRAKIGKYNPRRAQASSTAGGQPSSTQQPRVLFSSAIEGILTTANDGDIKTASLENPSNMDRALDEANRRIKTNRSEQDAYLSPMPAGSGGLLGMLTFGMASSSRVPAQRTGGCCDCFKGKKIAPKTRGQMTMTKAKTFDDGLSTLSAEDYVRFRLLPMLGEVSSETPGLSKRVFGTSVTVTIMSVASSSLSVFGLTVFIPAMLALSGALTSWNSYKQNEQRLLQKNIATGNLHALLLWWDGLTMIEKRVPTNKNTLVYQAESSIMAQATTLGTGGGTTSTGGGGGEGADSAAKGEKGDKGDLNGKT